MCLIPLPCMKSANSRDTNWGPLSVTSSCSGEPNTENTRLRVAMVLTAVVEVISKISGLGAKEIQATAMDAMVSGWMHSSLPCRKYMPWQVPQCLRPFQATTSHCEQRLHSHHPSVVVMQVFQESLLHFQGTTT